MNPWQVVKKHDFLKNSKKLQSPWGTGAQPNLLAMLLFFGTWDGWDQPTVFPQGHFVMFLQGGR